MLKVMLLLVLVSEDIFCRWSVCVSRLWIKWIYEQQGTRDNLKEAIYK